MAVAFAFAAEDKFFRSVDFATLRARAVLT